MLRRSFISFLAILQIAWCNPDTKISDETFRYLQINPGIKPKIFFYSRKTNKNSDLFSLPSNPTFTTLNNFTINWHKHETTKHNLQHSVFLLSGRNFIFLCFWSLKIKHLGSSNYQLVNHCNPLESYKNVLKCIVHCQGCLHLGLNHHGMHCMVNNIKKFIFNAYIFHKSTRKGLNKYSCHTEKPIMMQCYDVCNTNSVFSCNI